MKIESERAVGHFANNAYDGSMPFVDNPLVSTQTRVRQTWAIGGGKGGVGKSLVASSLAISLARLGFKVVSVDLDLGGANLHTTLGVNLPTHTLSDFILGKVRNISECIVPTGVPNLDLISGAQDALGITEISLPQKIDLLRQLRFVNADYLIYDLGAGTATHTVDFFNYSDVGFLVFLPEPTSIENGYRFIKAAYYRYLSCCSQLRPIHPFLTQAMEAKAGSEIQSPADLFRAVNKMSPELGLQLKRGIQNFTPKLIMNQARTQADSEIGNSIKTVCKRYFGFDLDFLGHLEYDTSVWQSVRKKRPLLLEFSYSSLSLAIDDFVRRILQTP